MRADRLRPLLRRAREAGVLPALLLGVAVSLGVTLLSQVGAFAGWQTRAVDAFQFVRDREPAPEIALVLVDEDAFRELGERQPLSRRFLADLADFLLRSGARVVALDVLLQVPSAADEDAALIATHARWPGRLVPRYAQLTAARPVPAADAARLLRPGEAMVVLMPSPGATYVVALRDGRALAAQADTAHPFYWAPFVLVGDGGAPPGP